MPNITYNDIIEYANDTGLSVEIAPTGRVVVRAGSATMKMTYHQFMKLVEEWRDTPRYEACWECDGTGDCPDCDGQGGHCENPDCDYCYGEDLCQTCFGGCHCVYCQGDGEVEV